MELGILGNAKLHIGVLYFPHPPQTAASKYRQRLLDRIILNLYDSRASLLKLRPLWKQTPTRNEIEEDERIFQLLWAIGTRRSRRLSHADQIFTRGFLWRAQRFGALRSKRFFRFFGQRSGVSRGGGRRFQAGGGATDGRRFAPLAHGMRGFGPTRAF
jgi:hypothetical protein